MSAFLSIFNLWTFADFSQSFAFNREIVFHPKLSSVFAREKTWMPNQIFSTSSLHNLKKKLWVFLQKRFLRKMLLESRKETPFSPNIFSIQILKISENSNCRITYSLMPGASNLAILVFSISCALSISGIPLMYSPKYSLFWGNLVTWPQLQRAFLR